MAYPPPDHYLSDLGVRPTLEAETSSVVLEVTPQLCGPDGSVLLGVLATLIDMTAGGLSRRQAQPDWVATSDLLIDLAAPIPPGPCRVDCRLARRGRGLVTLDLDLRASADVGAPRHGLATAAFAVLPNPGRDQGSGARGDGRERIEPSAVAPNVVAAGTEAAVPSRRRVLARPNAGLPLHQRLGIRVLEASSGVVEMDLDDYVRNTFGALQGGVVAVLAEAALLAVRGRPLVGLAVRYRTLGRVGPFRTEVERVAGGIGEIGRATLRDLGAGGATVAVATGRLATPD